MSIAMMFLFPIILVTVVLLFAWIASMYQQAEEAPETDTDFQDDGLDKEIRGDYEAYYQEKK